MANAFTSLHDLNLHSTVSTVLLPHLLLVFRFFFFTSSPKAVIEGEGRNQLLPDAVPIMEREEEAQSNDIQENRVKQFKGSSIQTSQDTLQDNPDWISRLPDSLLLRILSLLGIEEVIKTSLLSRRWRYLWVSIPCLDFSCLGTGRKFDKATFIDRFLFHHDDSKVRKLCIFIDCKEMHSLLVDSWIQFAVRHNVEVLNLDLVEGELPERTGPDYTLYKLPSSLFRCGSLTSLILCGCDLNLPATIQLNSLKTLCLELVDLDPSAIEHITSNCPLLEDLHLISCNRAIDLNICIANENVKKLTIYELGDCEIGKGITTIDSPNLISLRFCDRLPRTKYHVQKLRSLVTADFGSVGCDIDDCKDVLYDEDTGCDFAELLDDLRHVKELRLNTWCVQALTANLIRRFDLVTINATCIKMAIGFTKWELPGIAYLLRSASYIETLEIHCSCLPEYEPREEFLEEFHFEEKNFWKLWELDSSWSSILQNTKTIKISGFHSFFLDKDVNYWEREIEFVRFLLKASKVLERMTIETCITNRNDIEPMLEVTQRLTSFPRASPNAELFIT